ncbi:MAG: hypothetical protein U9Q15_00230 [Patescibacteria group bacterium]|nr:hypothetical protein [Patescibacteria group bacterium]
MMQFLQDSDIVIDLHSTSKPSTPMLILGSKQIDQNLLQSLDIEYIIQNIFGKTNGLSSLEYIESQNNNTICMAFESGQHNTETTKRAAIYNCQTILGYYGLITKQDTQIKRYRPKQLQVDTTLYSKSLSDRFLYSKTPKSFDTIPKNNPIVQLGNNTIHAPYDCYILMPSSPKTISEEIGYIAKCI